MKRISAACGAAVRAGVALAGIVLVAGAVPAGETAEAEAEMPMLAAGDPAPEFTMPGSDGKTHSLADYKGKQAVVIAWFPKAFTGG